MKHSVHCDVCFVLTEGKYRYHAVKEPYPTEVQIDVDFGYIAVDSVVVQNEYIFVQVLFIHSYIVTTSVSYQLPFFIVTIALCVTLVVMLQLSNMASLF